MNGDGMTSWVEQHLGSVVAALALTFALLGLDWLLDWRFDFWVSAVPLGKSGFLDAMTKITPTWVGLSLANITGKEVVKMVIAGRKLAAAEERADEAEERAEAAERRADAEQQRAAAEQQRADAEQQRAAAAEQQVAALQAERDRLREQQGRQADAGSADNPANSDR